MKHNFRASHLGSKNLSQLQHQRRATRVAATVSSFNQLQRIFSPRDFAGCLDMQVDRKTPRRGGRQQPHHSLKKFKKYKTGKKRHTMVTQSSPNRQTLLLNEVLRC
jgi:hypothetical protein